MTHKLNHTGNCAVSTDRHWMAVTDKAPPAGVKCNLLTRYGVAIIGTVTASNRPDFAGWEPLARVPDGMLTIHPCPDLVAIIRCVALVQFDGAPVEPCATCARRSESHPHGKNAEEKPRKRTPWTIPPAFWNGTRYACEHHIEFQPSSQTTTN